ncbi:site-specific recombinase XerD [Dysgonomonas hofstadii]|uniref:Site-specific recombinase XerD n=1 Tax=Dysgonomonas hofstadii TaxID=637886 RepID=A0A840CSB0_9BACT|nr:site-specific integrase [Dysgonomonas hofstadii]MBB4036534.1 site-specific recombinase XerD [Dysgonomonas hofstadii]
MASVKLYLDTRVPRKDGTYPLKIAVTHKGKFFINLKIYLKEDQLVGGEVVGHKSKKIYNTIIEQWLINVKKVLLDLAANGKINNLSHQQLKNIIENYNDSNEPDDETPYLFKEHLERFISTKEKKNTKDIYRATLNKIKKHTDIDNLTFEDINLSWLKGFQQNISEEGLSINAQGIHFRNIRAIFNDAIDEELISQSIYPFRRFKIKTEKTIKRSLTVEDLIQLRDYPCEEHQMKYRDLFMLTFYLIGINVIDLLHLKEIINGRIEYRREKTYRLYSIEVLPEAQAILDKYKGKDYLLNALDTYNYYKGFADKINKNIQEIGPFEIVEKIVKGKKKKIKERKPLFPSITTYWARHTWATIAASLDIPKETIAAALGHGGNSVTDIYINFDQKKIDDANKKVLKHIREYGKLKKKKASQK